MDWDLIIVVIMIVLAIILGIGLKFVIPILIRRSLAKTEEENRKNNQDENK